VIDANAMIQNTIISTNSAVTMPPTMIPASASPSPSSPVCRICRRAAMPSPRPTGAKTNANTSARIAMVLVGGR
jgi:hypothetical protein